LEFAKMSTERSTAKQQVKAWKDLIHILPIILSADNSKTHVESNFEEIDQACAEVGQTPDAIFGRLKRMSSAIVRKAKRVNGRNDEDESSSSASSDDDQALEFSNMGKKTKPSKLKQVDKGRKCSDCSGPISVNSKGLCRACYDKRQIRSCISCGAPRSNGSKELCKTCFNNRRSSRACISCNGPISKSSKGLCKKCYNEPPKSANESVSSKKVDPKMSEPKTPVRNSIKKAEPKKSEPKKSVSSKKADPKKSVSKSIKEAEPKKDICSQCMNDCFIFGVDMCEDCYSETVNKRAKGNLENTPVKRDSSKKKKSKRSANGSSSESDAKSKKRHMTEDLDE